MFEKKKYKRIIALSFSTCLLYSCAKKQTEYLNMDSANEKRIIAISLNAANSTFHDGTSSHVSSADMEQRMKNCSIDNLEFKNEIKEIFKEYNNKDLLSHVGNKAIPLVSILDKISKLTQSEKPLNANIYACYYPELYLANAMLMNTLQRVPLAPFNQESLLTSHSSDDPAESENWNEQDNFNKSRFAKLNGLIRSAAIAQQLVEKERIFADKIPRIYSLDEKANKQFLFGFKENISEEKLEYQLGALAEALSAIGFYERAIYRWNGVTSAKELNMPVTLPNESLQDDLKQLNSQFNIKNLDENNKLPLKLIIATDLLKAGQFATAALSGNNCSKNNTSNDVPTHFNSMCSELATIKEKAIKIDLKRLVCSSASKVAIEKSPADLLANMFWNEAQCDAYIKSEPELSNSFLNLKGHSYNFVNPATLNPLRLQVRLKFLQSEFEGLKDKISQINLLQTHDFENKKQELFDNIEELKNEFELNKKLETKASTELEFNRNQREAAQILLDGTRDEIEQVKIQQKNQLRNYISYLSTLNNINSLKKNLDNYSSQKEVSIKKYMTELCGNDNFENCSSGLQGKILNLSTEKYETAKNEWKNDCGKFVNHLNSVTFFIGKNGCDLSDIRKNFSTSTDPKEINRDIVNALEKLPKDSLPACKLAVIYEARSRLGNVELDKLNSKPIDGKTQYTTQECTNPDNSARDRGPPTQRSCRNVIKYIPNSEEITKVIDDLLKDYSNYNSTRPNTTGSSSPGPATEIKNYVNFVNSIAAFNTEKVYIQNYLGVNDGNRKLLTDPQKFCSAIIENSENSQRPKFASILDAQFSIKQAELQALQIKYSIGQSQIELDSTVNEKKIELNNQIQNIQTQIQNQENNLGISEDLRNLILSSVKNFSSSDYFENFYKEKIENNRFTELEIVLNKQKNNRAQLQTAKTSEKTSQENLAIVQMRSENLQSSIARAYARYESHGNSLALITSLSPNLKSFLNDIPLIYDVGALAKDYLNLSANKILNMPANSRNLLDKDYLHHLKLMSRAKQNCSYLASFYDAQNCLKDLNILHDNLLFKNESLYSQQKILSLQLYSSEYRDSLQLIADDTEQLFDNQFLHTLNTKGFSNLNFDEKLLSLKNFILEEFNNEYYNSRLIDMTVNIIQEYPRTNEYYSNPFLTKDNIAYLMRDGLDKNSLIPDQCGENFSNYSSGQYNNFISVLDNEKEQYAIYGKNFPYLFDPLHAQNSMCTKVKTIYSELPANINYSDNRITSLQWVQLLSKDANSTPIKNDIYWKPLTGYLSNSKNQLSNLKQLTHQISGCISSDDIYSASCANAKSSISSSFAGLPLLGKYTFVYSPYYLDQKVNQKRKSNQKIKTVGIELNFLISN
ncbi:hypothetical protein [Fluviispira multicolorata]|uniref:Uncharacterized protein n=1 Tax=Fluviispira multicolorata TaxID=2654512 RepID=A0A833JAT7_9BACT|nr:hypothetical protein [Fluviispira multicolorata]KAB8027423.1 hypothetical protein GCL57_14600 [Fluviispira multicolorata]